MRIVNASVDMAQSLIDYIKDISGETANLLMNPDEFNITEEQEVKHIQGQIDSRLGNMLVAFDGDNIVGLCGIHGRLGRRRVSHIVSLGITVSKSHWGKGIGYKLILAQIEYAKANNIKKINLEVRTDNPAAVHLYEKCGFVHEGINKSSMLVDGDYIDTYYMGLIL